MIWIIVFFNEKLSVQTQVGTNRAAVVHILRVQNAFFFRSFPPHVRSRWAMGSIVFNGRTLFSPSYRLRRVCKYVRNWVMKCGCSRVRRGFWTGIELIILYYIILWCRGSSLSSRPDTRRRRTNKQHYGYMYVRRCTDTLFDGNNTIIIIMFNDEKIAHGPQCTYVSI